MKNDPERACVRCMHLIPLRGFARCMRPTKDWDAVYGRFDPLDVSAYTERGSAKTFFGKVRCGPDGYFFSKRAVV